MLSSAGNVWASAEVRTVFCAHTSAMSTNSAMITICGRRSIRSPLEREPQLQGQCVDPRLTPQLVVVVLQLQCDRFRSVVTQPHRRTRTQSDIREDRFVVRSVDVLV